MPRFAFANLAMTENNADSTLDSAKQTKNAESNEKTAKNAESK
ncbi:hypothetical protein [Helicobacter sp. 23-1045]